MKRTLKCLTYVLILVVVCACGQSHPVNVEKDGTEYVIGDKVSVYYPKDYVVDLESVTNNQDESNTINFNSKDGGEKFYLRGIKETLDNEVEDRNELYEGSLEENGIKVNIKEKKLENGLEVYVYTGVNPTTSMSFKEVVYFADNETYVYGYQSDKKVYKENIKEMTVFLESLNLKTAKSSE